MAASSMALASSGAALATLRTALRWAAESAYAACTPPAFAWAVAATPPAFDTCQRRSAQLLCANFCALRELTTLPPAAVTAPSIEPSAAAAFACPAFSSASFAASLAFSSANLAA